MKKFNLLLVGIASLMFVTSCSNQIYSYRQKVRVEPKQEVAKAPEKIQPIESKAAKPAQAPVMQAPEKIAAAPQKPAETQAQSDKLVNRIQAMIPQGGSKAAFKPLAAMKKLGNVKNQVKALHKELKEPSQMPNINGVQWMILGLILVVAGLVLGLIGIGNIGGILYFVGGLVFLIGLIFFLIDYLK